jgi:hypothetical protein
MVCIPQRTNQNLLATKKLLVTSENASSNIPLLIKRSTFSFVSLIADRREGTLIEGEGMSSDDDNTFKLEGETE